MKERYGESDISASAGVGPETGPEEKRAPRRGRTPVWLARYPRAVPAALFLAIVAITLLSVFAIEKNARETEEAEMQAYASSVGAILDRRANTFASFLRAGSALLGSSTTVSPITFGRFVDELRLSEDRRGVQGVGWAPALNSDEIAQYQMRMREIDPDFPAISLPVFAQRDRIAPVTYFAPDPERRRGTLGFDLYSRDTLSEAMEQARLSVQPSASALFDLSIPGEASEPGFLIFMPVYQADPASRTGERELAGYLFTAFDAQGYLQSAIAEAGPRDFSFRLYDDAGQGGEVLAASGSAHVRGESFTLPVTIANRTARLDIDTGRVRTLAPLSVVSLIFGLAIASLLMLVARLLTRQAREDATRLAFYEEQQSIRDKLTRELNHRVKNTLANVLSMLSLTRRRSSNLDDFANSLEGRIRALSATHDLLTGTDWGTTPIRAVIEAELSHLGSARDHATTIAGPDVELAPNDALSFGLAIHELATNAAKFGALSVPGGSVSITWTLTNDMTARVEWLESGGPPVAQLRARGFGTELIEKIVAHELRHRVELEFRPEGVRCVIGVPVRRRSEFEIREARASA